MLQRTGALGLLAAMEHLLPPYAGANVLDAATQRSALPALSGDVVDLTIADTPFRVGDRTATAKTINGTVPGPVLRLKEGRKSR